MTITHRGAGLAALALAALPLALVPGTARAQEQLVISWWGFNGDKLDEFIVQPFQEQCGCELVFETGNNADRLNKVQIRGGAGVDVIYLTDAFSQIGIEAGLFQPIDRAKIPNIDGLYEIARAPQGADYGPAYTVGRIGIVYDSAQVAALTAWSDLWREDLAGKLSLPGITTTAGPMVVMLAGEQAGADAFSDPDAAFAEVAALEPNVVKNYRTGSEVINLFSTGEIAVSMLQDFALSRLQAAVPTVEWADLEDGDIAVLNTLNIPTGAENVDLAHAFINFVLDPDLQKTLAENGVDAPVVESVTLSQEAAANWTYGHEMLDSLQRVDNDRMNAAKDAWIERWNEIFGM